MANSVFNSSSFPHRLRIRPDKGTNGRPPATLDDQTLRNCSRLPTTHPWFDPTQPGNLDRGRHPLWHCTSGGPDSRSVLLVENEALRAALAK